MSGHEGERRRLSLGFATFLSVVVHLLLSLLMGVLTLRYEPSGVERRLERARPEAKAKRSASEFELFVAKEPAPRPVHEAPLEVAVDKPSPREEPVERPRPADRVVSPKAGEAEPVESPVAIELPRAAAAPKAAVDTPTKLSRQESDLGNETAENDASVALPKSVTSTAADEPRAVQPQPAARRPRAGPRSAATAVATARPRADETKSSEPASAIRRRSTPRTTSADSQERASIARAVTATEASGPFDSGAADEVEPLSLAAEPSRQEPSVSAPAAARLRPRTSGAVSGSVASKASRAARPIDGDAGADVAGGRRTARAESVAASIADSVPTEAIAALARAGGTGAGSGDAADAAPVARLVGEPNAPPAGEGPPDSPPAAALARRPTAAQRGGVRSRQNASTSRRRSGSPGSAAESAMADEAFAALVGGRSRGLEGSRGGLDAPAPQADSSSPARQLTDGAADVDAVAEAVEPVIVGGATAVAAGEAADDPFAAIAASPRPTRQPRGGPRPSVRLRGPDGPGGSEDEAGPQPGITARPSRRPIDALLENDERFLARVAAAALPVDGRVRQTAAPFMQRSPERRDQLRRGNRGTETEAAIERGLEFLARAQLPDGRWSLSRFPGATRADGGSIASDTAATGLALLSFLGAGYDHFGDRHADAVRRGLEFLRAVQKPDGDLYLESDEASGRSARLYSHAIATMAVCEAVGMTGDPLLRESATNACRFIASSQHEKRGGWRYMPGIGSDLSVSGWMLLALRSAQLAGIEVDRRSLAGVRVLLDTSQSVEEPDAYVYNPYASDTPEQRAGRMPSPTMNAVGLLMRLHMGTARNDPRIVRAAAKLAADLPSEGSPARPSRDCYLWYYAAQALFHVGGEAWDRWYGRLHDLLVASQETGGDQAGSWNPGGVVPDRWGGFGGRIYVTALNLLTLEVSYRHLPIYEVLARPPDDREPGRSSP
jgi:hypothetical protein